MLQSNNRRYVYRPLRGLWIIYEIVEYKSGQCDEIKVSTWKTKEEAKRETERLNGRQTARKPDSWFEFLINSFKS